MPIAKRKRGTRGPAPGTGGRPRKPDSERILRTVSVRLREADDERLQRLRRELDATREASESEVVRRALVALERELERGGAER